MNEIFFINIVKKALNFFISQLFAQVQHDYLQFLPIDKSVLFLGHGYFSGQKCHRRRSIS